MHSVLEAEYNFSSDKVLYTAYNNQQYPSSLKQHIESLFAEADIYATNDLAVKAGLRAEHSSCWEKLMCTKSLRGI